MQFEEVQERYRRHNAVEICIQRIKRVEMSASEAVRLLTEAAEGDRDVLLGLGGSGVDGDDEPDEWFIDDPLMTYVDGLIGAAAGGGEPPVPDSNDLVLMEQERRLLNTPPAAAFAQLCELIPGLGALEAEVRAKGELADPTEPAGWLRRLNRGFRERNPKAAFLFALRPRLRSLVGAQASVTDAPLAKTFVAYEVAWDHLRTLAGHGPERAWDEPQPLIPTPQEVIRNLREVYREGRHK